RRRHTRFSRDWSSDVCSSDLENIMSQYFERNEIVPGAFAEYTFTPNTEFDIVAGFRADYHNRLGMFYTPRLHVRYQPHQQTVIKIGRASCRERVKSQVIAIAV